MMHTTALEDAVKAMEKLDTAERIKLAEAIGNTIPDEFSVWIENK